MARNQFAGPCYICGLWVWKNTGHFERTVGAWRVRHGKAPGDGRVTCEMALKDQQEKSMGDKELIEALETAERDIGSVRKHVLRQVIERLSALDAALSALDAELDAVQMTGADGDWQTPKQLEAYRKFVAAIRAEAKEKNHVGD